MGTPIYRKTREVQFAAGGRQIAPICPLIDARTFCFFTYWTTIGTPQKGSPLHKRFGSGSGSADSPVRYHYPLQLTSPEASTNYFNYKGLEPQTRVSNQPIVAPTKQQCHANTNIKLSNSQQGDLLYIIDDCLQTYRNQKMMLVRI